MTSLSFRDLGLLMLTITLVFVVLLPTEINCEETLQLNVYLEKKTYDINELIRISGTVLTNTGDPVSNAIISIEVIGPERTTYHVALRYSDETGAFIEEYYTPEGAPTGIYTVYLRASRPGFAVISHNIQYSLIPEFGFLYAILLFIVLVLVISQTKRFKKHLIYGSTTRKSSN